MSSARKSLNAPRVPWLSTPLRHAFIGVVDVNAEQSLADQAWSTDHHDVVHFVRGGSREQAAEGADAVGARDLAPVFLIRGASGSKAPRRLHRGG